MTVIEGNYDDAVGLAAQNAAKYGWVVIQDTAWEGYTDIPAKVMTSWISLMKSLGHARLQQHSH